jgi:hypothetical protein
VTVTVWAPRFSSRMRAERSNGITNREIIAPSGRTVNGSDW